MRLMVMRDGREVIDAARDVTDQAETLWACSDNRAANLAKLYRKKMALRE